MILLVVVHVTALSAIAENTIRTSIEIMRIVADPLSVCWRLNACAWSFIVANVAVLWTTICHDELAALTNLIECNSLTDEEVFKYFPNDILYDQTLHAIHKLWPTTTPNLHDDKHLLASMHREVTNIDLQKPRDLKPFGLGQTPTQICSRIE